MVNISAHLRYPPSVEIIEVLGFFEQLALSQIRWCEHLFENKLGEDPSVFGVAFDEPTGAGLSVG